MGDQRLITPRIDEKMHMRRPHRGSPGLQKHFSNRAVRRYRITAWQNGTKEKPTVGVSDKSGPRGRSLRLVRGLLRVVKAIVIGMPDVHGNPSQWLTRQIRDAAANEHALARQFGRNI